MRKSLLWKLILAFSLVAVTSAAMVALYIRLASQTSLTRLIIDQQRSNLQENLAEYYQAQGTWDGVAANWKDLRMSAVPTPANPDPNPQPTPGNQSGGEFPPQPGERDRYKLFGLADAGGRVLIPIDDTHLEGSTAPDYMLSEGAPVTVDGKQVGTILVAPWQPRLNPEEYLFLQRTNDALLLSLALSLVVSLAVGTLLARTFIRPLLALTRATQAIANGQLEQQVDVHSGDEIGQLAAAFNRMSQEVARVNQQRRQMTADIAHDLRTPLTVISGYIESMRDGVLQPTPARLAIIGSEIDRLQNLVGDLKMLSQVDAGELPLHLQPILPNAILDEAAVTFQHRAEQKGIELRVETAPNLPRLNVDGARLMQVFGNLITNALRYTPAGGRICLSANACDTHVVLSVQDTGTGIDPDELPHIFERFRRADKSRHADDGETGLGLAIVKALVEAQGGTVWAESVQGEGTAVKIKLPVGG